jgi:ribose transport system permease protein
MVVTIGMSGVYAGLNLVMTKGKAVENIPKDIYFLGQGFLFGIPMPFVIMLILMIIVLFLVKFTQFGRYLYAIGNNKEAAKILGIKVNIIRTLAFSLTGLLSALAGILMVSRLGTSQPSIGTDWPLNSIAASVIGGVSMTGGLGNPFGAFIGATIICVISNLIVLFGVDPYWQTAVSGTVVVVAISIDSISMMIAAKQKLMKKLKE